jgi:CRP-like cAMP-binding protein
MILKEIDLFKGTDYAVMEKITDTCTEKIFDKNTVIFERGEAARYLYILEEGSIKLVIEKEASFTFSLTKHGTVFGWSSMAESGLYTSSAVCETDSKVIKLDNKGLNKIFKQHPEVGVTILRRLMDVFSDRLLSAYLAHSHLLTVQGSQTPPSYG